YSDSKLSTVHIQVLPYEKILSTGDAAIKSAITIFFDFYSKNAQKVCEVHYDEIYGAIHKFPDRDAINDFERAVFGKIPWKGVHWSEFLNKAYDKIKPLSISDDTHYQLSCMANSKNLPWRVTFFDGFNGRKRIFYWNGKGANEKDIEIKNLSIGEKPAD
ncbi:MAG: hypothetical protein M1167_00005, partial [Chloroflexi bacterium]|nr:hypothetical protein [Chloroflexota bacterium]